MCCQTSHCAAHAGISLTDTSLPPEPLGLIDEAGRLIALQQIARAEAALTYISAKDATVYMVKETIIEPDRSKYDNLFQEVAAGSHLDAFLNFITVIGMPKANGFIISWPLCYAFYKILMEKDYSTITNLAYLSSLLWALKRIGFYIYNAKSNLGT